MSGTILDLVEAGVTRIVMKPTKPEAQSSLAKAPGSANPTQLERDLRHIVREILISPENPGRWAAWAVVEMARCEVQRQWHNDKLSGGGDKH